MDVKAKREELLQLQAKIESLQAELAQADSLGDETSNPYAPTEFYAAYYAIAGFMLGGIAALASLLLNIIGAKASGIHPLELIRAYLTFPLGDAAMDLKFNSELTLVIGCCLYIGTGMVLGTIFHVVLTKISGNAAFVSRLVIATILSLILWFVNYYGLLSWLQPYLVKMKPENLIVNQIPIWVAILTHLVFGWMMALLYPWGQLTSLKNR